ncbi:ABC transporter permease [Paenibacillus arenosi]|uniref:ABC transporter permease n=1 Tax=Paenibacillus arenosi TaxID=2774142 RepID=A0ABR9B019_9BACL|nr:ABC transporter permease [Paenibacillus arenosi]MBD8499749.1 ABC transporter permease [Paenibacillus arenosi]
MNAFFKKDILVFCRDRKQILIPLILPIIMIVVMGFLLPNWMGNAPSSIKMKVGYVVKDDVENGLRKFQDSLAARGISEEEAVQLVGAAKEIHPANLLKYVFANEQVAEMIELTQLNEEEALLKLKAEEIHAIVTLPEGFTRGVLDKMLLGEGEGAAISLVAEDPTQEVSVLQGMIEGFMRQLNADAAIANAGAEAVKQGQMAWKPVVSEVGGVEQIEGINTVTTSQYFTLSITLIFTLFGAAAIAGKAVTEKREQVFQRILLSGSRPLSYLTGKISATFILAVVQLLLVFTVSHFALNVFSDFSLRFWIGFILLTVMLCVFIAAMSGLFTALMLRMNADIANGIINIFIIALGMVGGNFVPVYILPDSMQQLWGWTPNGLWLSTMVQWIQEQSWTVAVEGIMGLAVFTAVTVALSVWIFPKRGRI